MNTSELVINFIVLKVNTICFECVYNKLKTENFRDVYEYNDTFTIFVFRRKFDSRSLLKSNS